jgi:hypothetical protein
MKRLLFILFVWLLMTGTVWAIRVNIGPSMEHKYNIGPSQGGATTPAGNGPVGWF